jgi:nicotinate-nucleotide adenylyltransferase
MRLGIFGGTFDPVHYGHLLLAESCREQGGLDQVIFLPAAVPPHKQGWAMTPGKARIAMIELAIGGNDAFAVSGYEVERGGVNYTVDTLTHFRQEYPEAELFFPMGADMLSDLPGWREAPRVCQLALPLVVRRPDVAEPDFNLLSSVASPERIDEIRRHEVRMPPIGISATELRRRVRDGLSIRYQTPRAVEMYIATHGLYQAESGERRAE